MWRSRSQLELATVEWVSWYNHERLHEALGDIPPVEFEQLHQARQALIFGNASVTAPSQKAADRVTTRRLQLAGADLNVDGPISHRTAPDVRTLLAQAAPQAGQR